MGWFQSKQKQLLENLQEEQAYALAAYEIANREIRPGLWAKAFADSSGDEQRARAIYIKLRVAQVKLGVEVTAEMMAKAEQSLAIKAAASAEMNPPNKVCRLCGSSDVGVHSKTEEPAWCFSCRTKL